MDNIIPPVAKATIIETPERTNGKRKRDNELETNTSVSIITNLLEFIKRNHDLMITHKIDYDNSNPILRDLTTILFTQIAVLQREEDMAYCAENFERGEMIKDHIESLNNNNIHTNLHRIFRAADYQVREPKYVSIGNNKKIRTQSLLPIDIPLDSVVNLCMEKVFPTNYINITTIAKSEATIEQDDLIVEAVKNRMKQEYTFDDFVDDMFDECVEY
jgi:hypothetical protein